MGNVKTTRNDFGVLKTHPRLVYLDTCATSLKPDPVVHEISNYYQEYGVNIHRGVYELSHKATEAYESAREAVARFIHAKPEEIVFTKGTTSALNLVASGFGMSLIQEGDEIVTSELEHHSSLLPWMIVAKKKNAKLIYVPLDSSGRITFQNYLSVVSDRTKVVALTYVSNVLGYITPIEEIIAHAKSKNISTVVDAAQAVPHMKIDVSRLGCDFLAFSGHKMMGPTGIGVLYGRHKVLSKMEPIEFGGEMNDNVDKFDVFYKETPHKFEAGTPPIAGAIGLKRAIQYLEDIGVETIHDHSKRLAEMAVKELMKMDGVRVYNEEIDTSVVAFNIEGVHPHDAVSVYDADHIALRAGHHCAQLVSKWLKCAGTLRASFYLYNTEDDVERFIASTIKTRDFFRNF